MSYVRGRGLGANCDPSTMLPSVAGHYQCCPTDSACLSEAGIDPVDAPAGTTGAGLGLQYDTPSGTPWWMWLVVALALGAALLSPALSPA